MKTREEIERVYDILVDRAQDEFDGRLAEIREQREAALAELDDPMLRLIAAAKAQQKDHDAIRGGERCQHKPCVELRDAIDYAEQRRTQG